MVSLTTARTWTKDAPTKNGFYWLWLPGLEHQEAGIAGILLVGGAAAAHFPANARAYDISDGVVWWLGPTPTPEPPE